MGLDRAGAGPEQHRRHERAALAVTGEPRGRGRVAEDDVGRGAQGLDGLADLLALPERGERAHPDGLVAGVADRDRRELRCDRVGHLVGHGRRHDDATDGRALLSRLGGHLGDDALDEQVPLRVARRDVGAEHRAVERVGLDLELDAAVEHRRVLAQDPGGVRRAGEGHRVLDAEVVEQVAGRSGEQLERALGQDPRLDDAAHHELGEVGRLAGGLHDRREAGDEGRRELLEHAPDGEVEGVDLHGDAGSRGVDVLAEEDAGAAELLEVAVAHHVGVGQLAAALGGIAEHRAEAAVDVDHRVASGRAGGQRQLVELVLEPGQVRGQLLEEQRALVEGQLADRRSADRARVVGHRAEVEAGAGDPRDLLAGGRVQERVALRGGGVPPSGGIALEQSGHGGLPRDRGAVRQGGRCLRAGVTGDTLIADRSVSKCGRNPHVAPVPEDG